MHSRDPTYIIYRFYFLKKISWNSLEYCIWWSRYLWIRIININRFLYLFFVFVFRFQNYGFGILIKHMATLALSGDWWGWSRHKANLFRSYPNLLICYEAEAGNLQKAIFVFHIWIMMTKTIALNLTKTIRYKIKKI